MIVARRRTKFAKAAGFCRHPDAVVAFRLAPSPVMDGLRVAIATGTFGGFDEDMSLGSDVLSFVSRLRLDLEMTLRRIPEWLDATHPRRTRRELPAVELMIADCSASLVRVAWVGGCRGWLLRGRKTVGATQPHVSKNLVGQRGDELDSEVSALTTRTITRDAVPLSSIRWTPQARDALLMVSPTLARAVNWRNPNGLDASADIDEVVRTLDRALEEKGHPSGLTAGAGVLVHWG